MKNLNRIITVVTIFLLLNSCKKNEEISNPIQGNPGNPRFNLQFTNETSVDLDLYVQTPSGSIISYSNPRSNGGILDVDCLCGSCPNGPNENIYWVEGTAPRGVYKYWVKYYGNCGSSSSGSSQYTIRRIKNSDVQETFTGTLSTTGQLSQIYTFTY